MINPKAFVYSVPFDVGRKKTKITASHAIMVGKGNKKAPAAVAGMQIDYEHFRYVHACYTDNLHSDWFQKW